LPFFLHITSLLFQQRVNTINMMWPLVAGRKIKTFEMVISQSG